MASDLSQDATFIAECQFNKGKALKEVIANLNDLVAFDDYCFYKSKNWLYMQSLNSANDVSKLCVVPN